MSDPTPLKLRAYEKGRGIKLATIRIFQNENHAGSILIENQHADQVVALLNAATDMQAVMRRLVEWCDECVRVDAMQPIPDDLRDQARAAIAKAKPKGDDHEH